MVNEYNRKMTIYLTDELRQQLLAEADRNGCSISAMIRKILLDYLKTKKELIK